MSALRQRGWLTVAEVSAELGLSQRSVQSYVAALREARGRTQRVTADGRRRFYGFEKHAGTWLVPRQQMKRCAAAWGLAVPQVRARNGA